MRSGDPMVRACCGVWIAADTSDVGFRRVDTDATRAHFDAGSAAVDAIERRAAGDFLILLSGLRWSSYVRIEDVLLVMRRTGDVDAMSAECM